MNRGAIVRTGSPAAIRDGMAGRVVSLSCARPAEAYRSLRARWPASRLSLRGGSLRFRSSGDDRETRELLDAIESLGQGPVGRSDTAPTLEDAFTEIIARERGPAEVQA